MPRTHVAGIHRVVGEILLAQRAVLVADQPVLADLRGVELHLHLHVPGDGDQRGGQFVGQHLFRLHRAVDIGVIAVTDIGDALHHRLVVIAGAEAERRQRDAGVAVALHQLLQHLVVADPDVEVAVGRQEDAVHRPLAEVGARGGIGQLDPLPAGRGAAGIEAGERGIHVALVGGRLQDDPGAAGIGDDRHAVVGPQAAGQPAQRRLYQRQLVG